MFNGSLLFLKSISYNVLLKTFENFNLRTDEHFIKILLETFYLYVEKW